MFEKEEPVAAQQILDVWFRRRQQQVNVSLVHQPLQHRLVERRAGSCLRLRHAVLPLAALAQKPRPQKPRPMIRADQIDERSCLTAGYYANAGYPIRFIMRLWVLTPLCEPL